MSSRGKRHDQRGLFVLPSRCQHHLAYQHPNGFVRCPLCTRMWSSPNQGEPMSDTENTVLVAELPKCDICQADATYDAKITAGPWANLCEAHYVENRYYEELGVGKGQRLQVADSTPPASEGNADREVF